METKAPMYRRRLIIYNSYRSCDMSRTDTMANVHMTARQGGAGKNSTSVNREQMDAFHVSSDKCSICKSANAPAQQSKCCVAQPKIASENLGLGLQRSMQYSFAFPACSLYWLSIQYVFLFVYLFFVFEPCISEASTLIEGVHGKALDDRRRDCEIRADNDRNSL